MTYPQASTCACPPAATANVTLWLSQNSQMKASITFLITRRSHSAFVQALDSFNYVRLCCSFMSFIKRTPTERLEPSCPGRATIMTNAVPSPMSGPPPRRLMLILS